MVTILVAAHDSPPKRKGSAIYVCDGTDDHVQINQAISASEAGDTVLLAAGTYNVRGNLYPKGRTTFRGEGRNKTHLNFTNNAHLFVDAEYTNIEEFSFDGTGYSTSSHIWFGVVNIRASHARIRGVDGTADKTLGAVFHTLSCDMTPTAPLKDIEFKDCSATDTGTYGFLHNWWDNDPDLQTHTDIRYIRCSATRCGNANGTGAKGHFNNWVVGFDFAETNNIDNLYVNQCRAEENLESGFHMEWDPIKTNCVFEDCIAIGNGAKPYPHGPVKPNPSAILDYFGSGWYLPNYQGYLYRCTSEENSRCGFWVTNGGVLVDCVDRRCGHGRTDFTYVKPSSFYGYPCRTIRDGKSLHLVRCKSIDSNGYGYWYDLAAGVILEDCDLVNPAGIGGNGTQFGSQYSWYFKDSSIGFKKIIASPNVTAIYARHNNNVTYGPGVLVSDSEKPFVIAGVGTKDVTVQDWTTVSKTLRTGSVGLYLVEGASPGMVRWYNSRVVTEDPLPNYDPDPDPDPQPTPAPTSANIVPVVVVAAAGAGAYLLLKRAKKGTRLR